MKIKNIENIKGFMPAHEGEALTRWSQKFSKQGPLLEIGTFCGKSTIYICKGAEINNQNVFTIDHHQGSEEHQLNQEYFDEEIYDFENNCVNTFPIFKKNMHEFKIKNIIPIVADSNDVAQSWSTKLSLLFIDGSHSFKSANADYDNWEGFIKRSCALVIHDIFEDPTKGGQAPYEIYKRALNDGYKLYERVDTIVCLIKI